MVYTKRAEMAGVLCGTSHVITKQRCTTSCFLFVCFFLKKGQENKQENPHKKRMTYKSAVSLLGSGE